MMRQAGAVVVGAGIAGVATCYDLAVVRGVEGVIVVDPRPPLSLTSDKSSECYRNFFPNKPMVDLTNRSIDILETLKEQSDDFFNMSRRGYLFVTGDPEQLASLTRAAEASSGFGAGPVRIAGSAADVEEETGFDVYQNPEALLDRFPYLSDEALGALHVLRGGWFSAQQLGAWMLEQARGRGAEVVVDEVVDIKTLRGKVAGVLLKSGARISTPVVVNAAGPMSKPLARMVGLELPLQASLHHKVSFRDHLGAFPREAPMLLWTDPVSIDWSGTERSDLEAEGFHELLAEITTPVFGRPEGGLDSPFFEALWNYRPHVRDDPTWPAPRPDFMFPEAVLRGMAAMLPSLAGYRDQLPYSVVDGAYVMKTPENLPLIGPAGPEGFHLVTGMSGYGVMICAAAAELVGSHLTGSDLPGYADTFLLSRYEDPEYLATLDLVDTGELAKQGKKR
ncbi:MAG: FAD-binding oxidoreductase [bacterium]|nr:FAD-binding oxidoreductase [bacterium]MDE0600714.1 FAD-binding oxidoreductase [bacterium]